MKHIFLNLKRFDISPEKGGVNRLAPMQNWGAAIVSGTQEALAAYDPSEVEFVMYMPEAHILGAAAAKKAGSRCGSAVRAYTARIRRWAAISARSRRTVRRTPWRRWLRRHADRPLRRA